MKYKEIDLAKGVHYSLREWANFIGEERFAGEVLQGDRGGHLPSESTHFINILQRFHFRSERAI